MKVSIDLIKPNPNNPRTISDSKFKQLVQSMITFPQMLEKRPLICFTDGDELYTVLGGNMRLKAAHEIGMTEIDIMLADDWSPEQREEFLIKDNVNFGDWDWDELENNFDMGLMSDWGLNYPGLPDPLDGSEVDRNFFEDDGILGKSQYGVIVMCADEQAQEKAFKELTDAGHTCKIVVT